MGQCCSSKQHLKKKSTRNASTTSVLHPSDTINPVQHPSPRPVQPTPQHITDALVKKYLTDSVVARFCNCSYSTRCPHRPQITPTRRNGYRRLSEQDAYPRPPSTHRPRRITAPSYPACYPSPHEFPFPEMRSLSEIGTPIHSSSLIADHEKSCQVYKLGLSTLDGSYMSFQNTVLEDKTVMETLPSFNSSENSVREGHVYGYKFKPKKQLSDFEKSVIWV